MSDPSKKSSGKFIALAVAVVIIAAGAFFGVSWWEKKQARQIEETIKAASGSAASVKVGFWDKSAVITGWKISRSFPGMASFTLDVETLALSGLNTDALTTKGVVPLADSVTMSNVKMVLISLAPQDNSPLSTEKQEISFTSGALTGLRGDLAGLAAELERGMSVQELARDQQALLRIITIAKGIHADSASVFGYESRDYVGLPSPIVFTVESQQAKDVGLLTNGVSTWKNLKISAMGQDMASIEAMSIARMSLPDFLTPLVSAMPEEGLGLENMNALLGPALLKALEREPAVLKDFSLSNSSFQIMSPESVTLKNLALDVELGTEKLVLKKSFDDLIIPSSYYGTYDELGAALLAQFHSKPLNFSGRADLLANQKNGRVDLQIKHAGLTEKELGSFALDANLLASAPEPGTLEKFLQASPGWLVKNARLVLEDRKVLELAFAAQFEMLKPFADQIPLKSAADVRANTAQQLRQEAANAGNPDTKALFEGFAKLVQQPGTLVVTLNPETPRPLKDLSGAMEGDAPTPTAFAITTEFTPAKADAQSQAPAETSAEPAKQE